MIYTGAELFEGNGIKITNGEISTSETIYDMSSSDSSKNWGYTNGIGRGVTVSKDFSKYKRLRIYLFTPNYGNGIFGPVELSLQTFTNSGSYSAGGFWGLNYSYASNCYGYVAQIVVGQNKDWINNNSGVYNMATWTYDNNPASIYKIEGVY